MILSFLLLAALKAKGPASPSMILIDKNKLSLNYSIRNIQEHVIKIRERYFGDVLLLRIQIGETT